MAISIAIIDDGINEKYFNTGPLRHNIEVTQELQVVDRCEYDSLSPSHGAVCAAVIKKYASVDSISSVKILNDYDRGLKTQLVRALEWCIENGIRLVNISLGTIDYRDYTEIKKAVNKAYKEGLIIVAACDNSDIVTYPASLSNVIGVKCDKENRLKEGTFVYNSYAPDGVEITACGIHYIEEHTGSIKNTSNSNSYAAPFVTALVHNIMRDNPDITLEEIKETLRKKSLNYSDAFYYPSLYRNIDWVDSAIVFDLTEKGINISDHHTGFDIKRIIDKSCLYYSYDAKSIIDHIDENPEIFEVSDTVIVVEDETSTKRGHINYQELVEYLNQRKLNLVYLSSNYNKEESETKGRSIGIKLWNPYVYNLYKSSTTRNKGREVPIIAVWDYTGEDLFYVSNSLLDLFKGDGYFALVTTDSCFGILSGFEFTPLEDRWENTKARIEYLADIYEPDILIYSIDMSNKDEEHFKYLDKYCDSDINIYIKEHNAIFDRIEQTVTKEITVAVADSEYNGNEQMKEKTFNYSRSLSCIGGIYKHIQHLFYEYEAYAP
ncbi:MAG: S8 family serine peptidase [Bacillota bacterium]